MIKIAGACCNVPYSGIIAMDGRIPIVPVFSIINIKPVHKMPKDSRSGFQEFDGRHQVPLCVIERFDDEFFFVCRNHVIKRSLREPAVKFSIFGGNKWGKIMQIKRIVFCDKHRVLQHCFQFPYIPGPSV